MAAALLVPGSEVKLTGVGVNPTRRAYISLLQDMGAEIGFESSREYGGEAVADVVVRASELKGMDIPASWVSRIIDELPVLAVMARAPETESEFVAPGS